MLRIALSGCNGRMGSALTHMCADAEGYSIVAGFDINTIKKSSYPVYADPFEYAGGVDVVVDFTHPSSLPQLLKYCTQKKSGLVLATTGYSSEQESMIADAAKGIPVFRSANMSLGVNLLIDLVQKAVKVLNGFDIEIIEKHHNQKLDAPSGTAIMLADAVSGSLPYEPEYVYDRHTERKKRGSAEIGIHAVRGGTIVGEHEVIFAGQDEVITLSHSAHSREVFANGALNAALFIAGKAPGIYSMTDLVGAK